MVEDANNIMHCRRINKGVYFTVFSYQHDRFVFFNLLYLFLWCLFYSFFLISTIVLSFLTAFIYSFIPLEDVSIETVKQVSIESRGSCSVPKNDIFGNLSFLRVFSNIIHQTFAGVNQMLFSPAKNSLNIE